MFHKRRSNIWLLWLPLDSRAINSTEPPSICLLFSPCIEMRSQRHHRRHRAMLESLSRNKGTIAAIDLHWLAHSHMFNNNNNNWKNKSEKKTGQFIIWREKKTRRTKIVKLETNNIDQLGSQNMWTHLHGAKNCEHCIMLFHAQVWRRNILKIIIKINKSTFTWMFKLWCYDNDALYASNLHTHWGDRNSNNRPPLPSWSRHSGKTKNYTNFQCGQIVEKYFLQRPIPTYYFMVESTSRVSTDFLLLSITR